MNNKTSENHIRVRWNGRNKVRMRISWHCNEISIRSLDNWRRLRRDLTHVARGCIRFRPVTKNEWKKNPSLRSAYPLCVVHRAERILIRQKYKCQKKKKIFLFFSLSVYSVPKTVRPTIYNNTVTANRYTGSHEYISIFRITSISGFRTSCRMAVYSQYHHYYTRKTVFKYSLARSPPRIYL